MGEQLPHRMGKAAPQPPRVALPAVDQAAGGAGMHRGPSVSASHCSNACKQPSLGM